EKQTMLACREAPRLERSTRANSCSLPRGSLLFTSIQEPGEIASRILGQFTDQIVGSRFSQFREPLYRRESHTFHPSRTRRGHSSHRIFDYYAKLRLRSDSCGRKQKDLGRWLGPANFFSGHYRRKIFLESKLFQCFVGPPATR